MDVRKWLISKLTDQIKRLFLQLSALQLLFRLWWWNLFLALPHSTLVFLSSPTLVRHAFSHATQRGEDMQVAVFIKQFICFPYHSNIIWTFEWVIIWICMIEYFSTIFFLNTIYAYSVTYHISVLYCLVNSIQLRIRLHCTLASLNTQAFFAKYLVLLFLTKIHHDKYQLHILRSLPNAKNEHASDTTTFSLI